MFRIAWINDKGVTLPFATSLTEVQNALSGLTQNLNPTPKLLSSSLRSEIEGST